MRKILRKILTGFKAHFCRFYIEISGPWRIAKFYIGWNAYQKSESYSLRLAYGFSFAFKMFFDHGEWKLHYRLKIKKEPNLKWKVLFFPWMFKKPPLLETAVKSGAVL